MNELRAALELATEEELEDITHILFCRGLNPIDYFQMPEPIEVQSLGRQGWLDAIEDRFRFLAADGMTILMGRTHEVTYREAVVRACQYLKIPHPKDISTEDLEAEIFLRLLEQAWKRLPASEQGALTASIQRSLAPAEVSKCIPKAYHRDPIGCLVKGGSALAVSSVVRPWLLKQVARQFALHLAKYQIAREAVVRGGGAAAAKLQSYVALQAARRGVALSAARYGATRSVLAFMGPMLWGWFLADLGWRAIAVNYGRIIPTIFALAQIRLTRSMEWQPA
ncbi:MAG: hypothetical protein HC925_02915 [Coleofasciculaceae cyanobacterium SM2_3_26]|nr:hypothetical protein [Coleofasciculaceae cyanobacterium SM2_3_26]